MANVYEQFDTDNYTDTVTPADRLDPTNKGLTDEEIRGARRPVAATNPYEQFDQFDAPVAAPTVETPKKGFFQGSVLDQIIGGYHDLRSGSETYGAIKDIGTAQRLEKGGDVIPSGGGIIGGLSRTLAPEQRDALAKQYRADALAELAAAKLHAAKGQERPLSPEAKAFLDQNSGKTVWEAFKAAPAKIIVEIGMRSAAASGVALAGGIAGGVGTAAVTGGAGSTAGFMAGMGGTSARIEYASSIVDALQASGVDVNSPDALGKALADEEFMHKIEKTATIRAAVIGGVDAISGFLGTKVLAPAMKSQLARELVNAGVQMPAQAALGAAGEAGGEIAAGQPLDPRQIAAEAAGEFVTAPVDIAGAAVSGMRPKPEVAAPGPLEDMNAAKPVPNVIEEARTAARARVAANGGDTLDQEVAAAMAAAEVSSHRRGAHDITKNQIQQAQQQLQVEQAYATGTAQSEEDNARAQIQSEAAARYEQGIPAPAAAPLEVVKTTPEVRVAPSAVSESVLTKPAAQVDKVAAVDAEKAKSADYDKALVQRDQQVATRQAFEGEPAKASIAEIAGPPKTLAERRARDAATKVAVPMQKTAEVDTNSTTSAQVGTKLPALPAPRTARYEVDEKGVSRPVSEAEMESRNPATREGLTIQKGGKEMPQAPVREVAPNALAARRAEIAQKREIDDAAAQAASSPKNDLAEPTQGQREAGNYKMGHVKIHGLDISIETPRGGIRTYKKGGAVASRRMRDHYGYVRRTEGADGDHVDVFVGEAPRSDKVFVIDQVKPDGTFDEHKAMLGYPDEATAVAAYKRNYQADWKVGPVTEMPVNEFKKWAQEGDTKAPLKPDAIRARKMLQPRKPKSDGRLAEGDEPINLAERRAARDAAQNKKPRAPETLDGKGLKEIHKGFKRIPEGTSVLASHGLKYQTPVKVKVVGTHMFASPVFDKETYKRTGKTEMMALPIVDFGDGKPRKLLPHNIHEVYAPRGRLAEGDVTVKELQGRVVASSEHEGNDMAGGAITASKVPGQNVLRINHSIVPKDLRGQRRGIAMMEKLVEKAESEGLALHSDTQVSKDAERLYDALERRGYTVTRNQEVYREGGALHSGNTRPVFEVSRPKTAAKRSEPTTALRESKTSAREANKPRNRLTKVEVDAALKDFFAEVGTDGHQVLESVTDLPEEILSRMVTQHGAQRMMNARGLYDRKTDTVWIFAENHQTPEKALKTAIHEIVAHQGLKKLLGKEHTALMLDVFRAAKDRAWMTDFMAQHKMAENDVSKVIAADEYIASISERQEDLTALERAIAAVRTFLRKLGLVDKWTDADIRALLAKSYSGLRDASPHGRDSTEDGSRLAPGELEPPKTADDHPNSRLFKMNVTAEDQANYNPGFVRSRLDAIRDFGENAIPKALALIPRRNLPDFMAPDKMPSMKAYIRAAQRMDGRRSELLQASDDTAKKWLKFTTKNKDEGRILGELMHAATLATVDPANAFQPLYTGKRALTAEQTAIENRRRGQYNALRKHWNSLSGEAKAIYIEVRDAYAHQRDLTQQGLEARINAAEADGKTKQALVAALREKFEAGRVAGPYFPLARFGQHWASAKDKNGNTIAFSRFEKPSEQRAWQNEMRREGFTVDGGVKSDDAGIVKRIDPNFVSKIAAMLEEIDPEMADEVWQTYLRALPEMSMRKHFIHRKGRLGFTADALRAFAHQQFHGAHQIAKLEHMAVMDSLVEQIAVEADKLRNTPEEKWSAGLRDEFAKRHEWAKSPQSSLWATKLTGLGFAFYLGLTPAAALVNLTQTAIVGGPVLAARFNWLGAGTELSKAGALYAGSRGPMANRLRGDEQKAFEEAQRIGLFDKTQAHDLAGLSEEGSGDYGGKRQKVAQVISWAFHKTEQANREITFLAAYRLSRKKGRNHNDAILEAEDLTWDSHFDYANTNRPRVLQNDTMKVLFLFRQYSLNMTYRLARDFNDSIRGATPTAKKEARTRFAGIMGQTFLFAGASGLPLFWLVKLICNSIFGDDDEPFDTEAAMRAHLFEMTKSEKWSSAVMDGAVSALSHADISSRVGLNNLWMREPPPGTEGEALAMFYLKELAGPLPAIGVSAFEAAAMNDQGYGDRAFEKLSPKAVSDALKMLRYAREGVTSKRGDELISPEEISSYELFLQGMGFVPADIALQYDQNRAVKGAEQAIMDRRALLLNRLALAAQNNDATARTEALAAIQAFSKKNPGVGVDFDSLWASAKARARYSMEAVNGVRVEPGLRYLHEQLRFTDKKEDADVPASP